MGARQTFEGITLDRHHPLGTAAKTIADARPGSICSAEGQCSNKDPAGGYHNSDGDELQGAFVREGLPAGCLRWPRLLSRVARTLAW